MLMSSSITMLITAIFKLGLCLLFWDSLFVPFFHWCGLGWGQCVGKRKFICRRFRIYRSRVGPSHRVVQGPTFRRAQIRMKKDFASMFTCSHPETSRPRVPCSLKMGLARNLNLRDAFGQKKAIVTTLAVEYEETAALANTGWEFGGRASFFGV